MDEKNDNSNNYTSERAITNRQLNKETNKTREKKL